MKTVLRFVLWGLIGVVSLAVALAALLGYFMYTNPLEVPQLSGTLTRETIEVDGLTRTYRSYVAANAQDFTVTVK